MESAEAVGIFASNIKVMSDVTVKTSNCENKLHGIVCDSSLLVAEKATVTVKSIDKDAFITQANVNGVYGQGFDEVKLKMKPTDARPIKPIKSDDDVALPGGHPESLA